MTETENSFRLSPGDLTDSKVDGDRPMAITPRLEKAIKMHGCLELLELNLWTPVTIDFYEGNDPEEFLAKIPPRMLEQHLYGHVEEISLLWALSEECPKLKDDPVIGKILRKRAARRFKPRGMMLLALWQLCDRLHGRNQGYEYKNSWHWFLALMNDEIKRQHKAIYSAPDRLRGDGKERQLKRMAELKLLKEATKRKDASIVPSANYKDRPHLYKAIHRSLLSVRYKENQSVIDAWKNYLKSYTACVRHAKGAAIHVLFCKDGELRKQEGPGAGSIPVLREQTQAIREILAPAFTKNVSSAGINTE